ncbi:MAG: GNAT family N-acetyltransferase [Muribaculaceae bacterium]|nr:GNAT family N-acetyltransferase [Muribaculaceae bacterium]
MKVNIKRFDELTTAELYEILRCRAEVFVVEQKCQYQDIDNLDRLSTHVYIEKDGKILTYLRVIDPGVKFPEASIGRVLVMKEARGQGLARRMMAEAIRIAKEKAPAIEIEAQAYLKDFYKSFGFVETSEEFLDAGIPHIAMRLE